MQQISRITFGIPDPKLKTPRDSKYKVWVKLQPCFNCGQAPAGDPHHYQPIGGGCGVGMKVSDLWCIPLCRDCHISAQNDRFFFADGDGMNDDRWVLVKIIKMHDEYFNWGQI